MSNKEDASISLGVQAGDPQADAAVSGPHKELRALFLEHCSRRYGKDIDAFAPVLRVDGDVWHWDTTGVDNVRLGKKARRATFDIFLPTSAWRGQDSRTVKQLIANGLRTGMHAVIEKAKKEKVDVDGEQLSADLDVVLSKFLKA